MGSRKPVNPFSVSVKLCLLAIVLFWHCKRRKGTEFFVEFLNCASANHSAFTREGCVTLAALFNCEFIAVVSAAE